MSTYRLSIITANGEVFNDQVTSLIAPGELGSFGVLGNHAPMIISLSDGALTVTQNGTEQYFRVSPGVLEVNDQSNVLVLVDSAEVVKSPDEAKTESAVNDGK